MILESRRLAAEHSLIAALTPSQSGAVMNALQQRLSLVQGALGTPTPAYLREVSFDRCFQYVPMCVDNLSPRQTYFIAARGGLFYKHNGL